MPNFYPPFRQYCGGDAPVYQGTLWQHAGGNDKRDRYTNSTTVPNPDTEAGGTVAPFERWTPNFDATPNCEVHHCTEDSGGPPCSQWLRPFTANTFAHTTGDKTDFGVCHKRGFKNVQARRYWNGAWGFKNPEPSNGATTTQCCDGHISMVRWRGYTSTVPTSKYTTLTITAEDTEEQFNYDVDCNPTGTQVNWDDTASVTESIDPNSGLLTISALSVSPNTSLNRALGDIGANGFLNWAEIVDRMTASTHTALSDAGHIDCTDNSITVYNDLEDTGTAVVDELVEWDLAAGTFRRRYFDYTTGSQQTSEDEKFTVSDAVLAYSLEQWNYDSGCSPGLATHSLATVTATLSGTNTSASIYADIKNNLLSLWPLNDDALYQWRSDAKVSVAPLVSRDETFTDSFTNAFYLKDYGSPIADSGGATIGDAGWSGTCELIIQPDPNTGTKVQIIDLNVTSGDVVAAGADGFGFTTVTGYSVSGTLPPGTSFDSSTGQISGTATATGHYGVTITVTGATAAFTGAILGAPKLAGYEDFFDFGFQDWAGCCFTPSDNPDEKIWSWYQVGWGGTVATFNINASCSLPLNATQWTNFFQAVNKPQGAFLFYNDLRADYWPGDCHSTDDSTSGALQSNALWAGKYAECLDMYPSQNFALPAGDMKFWFDETQVFCAVNASGSGEGSTWTLTDPSTGSAPPDATSFTGVWGGPVVGGFYNVTSYSGGTLTLGSKVWDVPSNWASKSNSDEASCFGKLRFLVGATVPSSILGRETVTPDSSGTIFTFAAAQPAFGMDSSTHQEQVDLWDANMAAVAANVTANRITTAWGSGTGYTVGQVILDSNKNVQQCSVAGTSGGSAPTWATSGTTTDGGVTWTFLGSADTVIQTGSAYPLAKWLTIHGAPKWYINDISPKGDYAVLEWLADLRSIGEYGRLTGILDCSSTQVTQPTTNTGGGPVSQPFASFTQHGCCLPFMSCAPKVVCISPNGETWDNGITYAFPETFACDEQYGSKWWGYVQSVMSDLFWQKPHRPCNIETCAKWMMDDGTCKDNAPGVCPGDEDYISDDETPPSIFYYAIPPQVETRVTVPFNAEVDCGYGYGTNNDESAPALPTGIQIGWLSPVTTAGTDPSSPLPSDDYAGQVALPPEPPGAVSDRGEPAGIFSAWVMHDTLCAHADGCRFNYVLPDC